MSHHQPVISPAGTPLPQRSVGELVAAHPHLSRVFQNHGLDFCCQGGRTVEDACTRKGIALTGVVADLEAALAEPAPETFIAAQLPVEDLVRHIVERHHDYLRAELPRLHAMAQRVAHVHGGHTPSLVETFAVFDGLAEELNQHTEKEEQILFPAILNLVKNGDTPLALDAPVQRMMAEHDDAGEALARLRELTDGFVPPASACNTYRALFAGLAELEDDMQRHIHLENSVLFPRALQLQAG